MQRGQQRLCHELLSELRVVDAVTVQSLPACIRRPAIRRRLVGKLLVHVDELHACHRRDRGHQNRKLHVDHVLPPDVRWRGDAHKDSRLTGKRAELRDEVHVIVDERRRVAPIDLVRVVVAEHDHHHRVGGCKANRIEDHGKAGSCLWRAGHFPVAVRRIQLRVVSRTLPLNARRILAEVINPPSVAERFLQEIGVLDIIAVAARDRVTRRVVTPRAGRRMLDIVGRERVADHG